MISEKQNIIANIRKEKEIIKELLLLSSYSAEERLFVEEAKRSLIYQLKVLSDSVSGMLQGIEDSKKGKAKKKEFQRIETSTGVVFIDKKVQEQFKKQLGFEKVAIEKIKTKFKSVPKGPVGLKKPPFLVSFASIVFRRLASSLIKQGYYDSVRNDLQKANMPYLVSSYVSLTFLITFFVLIISLAVSIGLSTHATLLRNVIIALAISIFVYIFAINYPSLSVSSARSRIDDELPFAISHIAAIASSGVDPSKIFPIMSNVKEYPFFSQEAKKIVNQMNVYGLDLTTSLKNVAATTSSEKLAELLNGIATTTRTGGDLVKYLGEKSKDSMTDFRLRRQKYSEFVGMLSDIYTALLIAAPLILMLILAIIGVIGSSFAGLSITSLATIGLVVILVLNIVFLIFIHITQPKT
ncbi:MAG: type II secretion system F family protein [Candidatus Pacearchaeota archaeon]